jgi:sugar phosphate isomerase/epimerase
MKFGVSLPGPIEDQIPVAKEHGFQGLHLTGSQIINNDRDKVRDLLARNGLEVAQVGAWFFNPLNPNPKMKDDSLASIRVAGELGVKTVVAPSGSANPDHPFCAHPDNYTEKGMAQAAEHLRDFAKAAEDAGVIVAIEPHFGNVFCSPEVCAEMLERIGSEAIGIQLDVANMVRFEDIFDTTDLIERTFASLKGRIPSAHAKDIKMDNDLHLHLVECPAHEGCLKYDLLLERLGAELGDDHYMILEHTPLEKLADAVAYMRDCAKKAGVVLGNGAA